MLNIYEITTLRRGSVICLSVYLPIFVMDLGGMLPKIIRDITDRFLAFGERFLKTLKRKIQKTFEAVRIIELLVDILKI